MKQMKKTIFFSIFAIFCSFIGNAQTAYNILDKVVNRLETAPSITMKMTLSGNGVNESASLTMAKEKFAYKVGSLSVFFDGTTQWTVDNSEHEISLTEPTPDELIESNPLTFVRNYKKKYRAEIVSENTKTATIKMTTTDKKAYIRSAEIVIDRTTWLPTRVEAWLATGQNLRINIATSSVGKSLPLTTFRCDTKAFPRYEVIDLR